MDKKKTQTIEDLMKEEGPESKEFKEEIINERGSRKKVWWILGTIFMFFVLVGVGYTVWKSYSADKTLSREDKVQNAPVTAQNTTTPKTIVINAEGGLNLRKDASSSSELILTIPNSTNLVMIEEKDGWYKVEYGGQTGWVSKEFTLQK